MIFETLNQMGIPYMVIKYKITSIISVDTPIYRYQIMVMHDDRLERLGFKPEKEIYRYKDYMYRKLTQREISIFRTYGLKPSSMDEDGIVWEINGSVQRYRNPYTRKSRFNRRRSSQ